MPAITPIYRRIAKSCALFILEALWGRRSETMRETPGSSVRKLVRGAAQAAALTSVLTLGAAALQAAPPGPSSRGLAPRAPHPTQPVAPRSTKPLRADGVKVQFTQLHWLGDDGTVRVPFSRVGAVTLSFDAETAEQLSQQTAYFNLTTVVGGQVRWSVRNLRLHYRDAKRALASHPSVQFAIAARPGEALDSLRFSYSLTAAIVKSNPVT